MTEPVIFREADRVRIRRTARTGTIKRLFDGRDAAGELTGFAMIVDDDHCPDARPVADLEHVAPRAG
ncbi:MAG: hypothetical protein NBV67_00255 [Tagaea sp.]|nr:hypothetical protein [Tagaea sp.]